MATLDSGLGVGTTPGALIAHGIDTTVVEIDPVVHQFASKYFQLPANHHAVIEDAVAYTGRLAADDDAQRFDYIIHDVFTGGAEPIALFTLEFLQSLDALLQPGGVVAIVSLRLSSCLALDRRTIITKSYVHLQNYAGDFALPPPKVVVQTIRRVFPSCRIFREHPRDEAEVAKTGRDFTNMVIFCTKLADRPVTFRKPGWRDLLNSPSREAFLYPKHEVHESEFVAGGVEDGAILTANDTSQLEAWHETSAAGHWKIMRTVLPSQVWLAW